MEIKDKDLASLQQVRTLLYNANEAKKQMAKMSQQQLDNIVKAIAESGADNAQRLAKLAAEETGFGKWQDKEIKNLFASKNVYESVKNIKTVGLIKTDDEKGVREYACPVGVIGALVPSTNPTSTVIYKSIIAIKSGNPIVFSPHPKALNCILETVKVKYKAAVDAGLPGGGISCITIPTVQATEELMRHKYTNLILATGGPGMVKAAYSSGTPAIGVGAGNGPAFIDKTADVDMAVKRIIASKTFDNGTICASEQSIVIEKCMEDTVIDFLKKYGAYIMSDEDSKKLAKILFKNGKMNAEIVGKPASYVAKQAGINVPDDVTVLIARETSVGINAPYSQEKLTPVLALYVESNLEKAMEKCVDILRFEGVGHSFMLHCTDAELADKFAKVIPASRILVNTSGSLGGVGATTNLFPALTLGCGAEGGSSSSNNIGPLDLINIKRVAFGVREIDDIKKTETHQTITADMVEYIVSSVMKKLI